MDFDLRGKIAIVTGATANIGRAIALELAAEGVCLVAVGRDTEAGAREFRHRSGLVRGWWLAAVSFS